MNERGQYGGPRVGQLPGGHVVYVEREPTSSFGKLLVGVLAVGGAVLWAHHQSKQIERLSAKTGLPQPSFASTLRETARDTASRARAGLHALTAPSAKGSGG